ncbi:MAG TPA: dienelactone hydrolase family protein [Thermomicrobiales bacterium]|jgi:carboxymethylenebutenolidase|nr:dienelactone hydrolase family protein [Thermomicrobiales bacterium]
MRPYQEIDRYRELTQMQQYLVHEFIDDYHDGVMSRRDMMRRIMHITGGVAATATILTTMGVPVASAQDGTPAPPPTPIAPQSPLSIAEDDLSVSATMTAFPGADGAEIMAYEVRPATGTGTPAATPGAETLPLVLICHENRGLTPHIRDVTRRWASNGYVAVALDLLSREGGTEGVADPAQIPSILSDGDPNRHVGDFQAAIAYYSGQPGVDPDRIGMNGFCFGGGITWRTVCAAPEIRVAAPYYGPPPPLEGVPNIQAAVLGVYAEDPEDFANNGRDELEAALNDAGTTFEIRVYPGTEHAFHNDTGPRYNAEQAATAWQDTLDWFASHLA